MTEKSMITFEKSENCIYFYTLNKKYGSKKVIRSSGFYILKDEINNLLNQYKSKNFGSLITRDIRSFTELRICNDMLFMDITWLNSNGFEVSGYEESYEIPVEKFIHFIESPITEYKAMKKPTEFGVEICFKSRKNLKEVLSNKLLKRKFIKFMMNNFQYPKYRNTKIILKDDYIKYSFFFTVYYDGKEAYCGGIILHGQDREVKDMYYAMHT